MTNSTNIKNAINSAANLDELLEALNTYEDADISIDQSDADLCGLPTFGGEEPEDTAGIWSWDADRLLINGVNAGEFLIETREEYYA